MIHRDPAIVEIAYLLDSREHRLDREDAVCKTLNAIWCLGQMLPEHLGEPGLTSFRLPKDWNAEKTSAFLDRVGLRFVMKHLEITLNSSGAHALRFVHVRSPLESVKLVGSGRGNCILVGPAQAGIRGKPGSLMLDVSELSDDVVKSMTYRVRHDPDRNTSFYKDYPLQHYPLLKRRPAPIR